jgi:RNA polymerase sigma-70 factor (ECF subfamily)
VLRWIFAAAGRKITTTVNSTHPLLGHLEAFTGFVRSRTGDPELAADIVQDALLKALRSENAPQDEEGMVTWFYRILRNAIIDTHRRSTVRGRALERLSQEPPETAAPEDEKAVCRCVLNLLPALPRADAELFRRIDLGGESATELARASGKRVNTVNVRLYRARRRLRAELERVCRTCATHGCLDCDCG